MNGFLFRALDKPVDYGFFSSVVMLNRIGFTNYIDMDYKWNSILMLIVRVLNNMIILNALECLQLFGVQIWKTAILLENTDLSLSSIRKGILSIIVNVLVASLWSFLLHPCWGFCVVQLLLHFDHEA